MGDPKKLKKKFSTPGHPWEATRIKEESKLTKEYGLVNKKEIWRARSLLGKWHTLVRTMISLSDEEKEKAESIIITKLNKLGILKEGSHIDDVLALTEKEILERRLQTQLYKQGFTNTIKQARQFIVHQKVMVNDNKITSPAFLVEQESKIRFIAGFTPQVKKKLVLAKKESKGSVDKLEANRKSTTPSDIKQNNTEVVKNAKGQ